MTEYSKSRVNRAGRTLRKWWSLGIPGDAAVTEAVSILVDYRAAHSTPLIKATMGLRSMVKSEGCQVRVSQRLKRFETILNKLEREPTMALASMQDIGGCRAIVGSLEELRRVQARVTRNRNPIRVDDYIATPRSSGYRAVHLIVKYDDRCIEIQLRTQLQHQWAVAVERFGGQFDLDLKSGIGPQPLLDWFGAISEALALEDQGEVVASGLSERIGILRREAEDYLSREQ